MNLKRICTGLATILLLSGFTLPEREHSAAGPGTSKETAIETCLPKGSYEYLSRLRCPGDDGPAMFRRRASVGSRLEPPPGSPEAERRDRQLQPGESAPKELMRWLDPTRRIEPGEIDQHIVDVYEVVCTDGRYRVFIDMYHCADAPTTLVPPGFTLAR